MGNSRNSLWKGLHGYGRHTTEVFQNATGCHFQISEPDITSAFVQLLFVLTLSTKLLEANKVARKLE